MKIFYLTELLSPYRIEWMNLLCEGNMVTAYYINSEEKTREQEWLNSHRPRFRTVQVEKSRLSGRLPAKRFISDVRDKDYDIYIIDGYSSPIKLKTIRLLLKRRKKVFINIDGIDIWREKRPADLIKDAVKRRVFRSGAYFLCGSKIAARTVIGEGAEEDRVFVHPFTSLHDGDILSEDKKQELQRQFKRQFGKEDQKVALAVGRFIPLKQYDRLIEAWKAMPDDCFLYLIGGGEERESYEKLIREKDVRNIELLDFVHPEKLREYFYAADLFVHPSRTETWGLVINEAMANGCPVIATDRCVAAVELIADGEEGYLVKVGDTGALHEKMRRILTDDALRREMTRKALKRIRDYTYENLAATHLKIFRKIMR